MKLLVSQERAIKILRDRISEIDNFDFNPEAWKERTVLDLKEIFPLGSSQYLKIQFLRFDTFVVSEKEKVLAETKRNAKGILESYISFIEEYSKVAEERKIISEENYQQKYTELMKDRNEVVKDCNKIIREYEEQLELNAELLNLNDNLNNQIEKIRKDTIQIDNVSMSKLGKAFFNLPIWQIVTTFSIIIGIVIGCFSLGKLYQENAANNLICKLPLIRTV